MLGQPEGVRVHTGAAAVRPSMGAPASCRQRVHDYFHEAAKGGGEREREARLQEIQYSP